MILAGVAYMSNVFMGRGYLPLRNIKMVSASIGTSINLSVFIKILKLVCNFSDV